MNVLEFMSETGLSLINAYSRIFEFFNYTITIPFFSFKDFNLNNVEISIFQIMFSAGVYYYIMWQIWKWVKQFLPFI